ncbi:MAG: VOC family protein [Rudaea sp.]
MPFKLDHVFICCDEGGPEAQALLDAGLTEGSRNTHTGQGTANRRFFFADGYIELIWIFDAPQATSALTAPTRLWERWSARHAGACPFGLAYRLDGDDDAVPPFQTWPYRPQYLSGERRILFARDTPLDEPELFCLAWHNPAADMPAQPRAHALPLREMRSVSVGLPQRGGLSPNASAAKTAALVSFHQSAAYELVIRFGAHADLHCDLRPALPLILRGESEAA